jgi:hypothetical protein
LSAEALVGLGVHAAEGSFGVIFAKGIIGGWLIALVAWMVTAAHWTIGQIAVTWLLTFIVGAGISPTALPAARKYSPPFFRGTSLFFTSSPGCSRRRWGTLSEAWLS